MCCMYKKDTQLATTMYWYHNRRLSRHDMY